MAKPIVWSEASYYSRAHTVRSEEQEESSVFISAEKQFGRSANGMTKIEKKSLWIAAHGWAAKTPILRKLSRRPSLTTRSIFRPSGIDGEVLATKRYLFFSFSNYVRNPSIDLKQQ